MSEPSYQFVIQFPESAFSASDDLVRYEDALISVLGETHDLDGHDIGSGEVNFFVFTDDPVGALDMIRKAMGGVLLSHPEVRAAARLIDDEIYQPLWPLGDVRDFDIV